MFKVRLELNYARLDLGADTLADMVRMLPARQDASEVFDELAKCPFAKVREEVAGKGNLTDETVTVLAQDKNQAVLVALINNDEANQRIPASRIDELIAADDSEMLRVIFQNLQNMTQLDTARIFHLLAIHKDAAIRLEVARSSDTDAELLHHLARDEDPDVRDAALTTLQTYGTADLDSILED
jgi:hypothetical protein